MTFDSPDTLPTEATVPSEARDAVDALRQSVADLHRELTRYGLVVWTAGNVSARVPGHDLMVIKPSGVAYDELTAANMVVTDLFGALVEGSTPLPRTPPPTPTCIDTCPTSAVSSTRTRRTPPRGPPAPSRSPV